MIQFLPILWHNTRWGSKRNGETEAQRPTIPPAHNATNWYSAHATLSGVGIAPPQAGAASAEVPGRFWSGIGEFDGDTGGAIGEGGRDEGGSEYEDSNVGAAQQVRFTVVAVDAEVEVVMLVGVVVVASSGASPMICKVFAPVSKTTSQEQAPKSSLNSTSL